MMYLPLKQRGMTVALFIVDQRMPVMTSTQFLMVFLPDGSALEQTSPRELAERIGLQTRTQRAFYDLVIIGGGPAGLAGAVCAASEGLRTVLVERSAPGSQAGGSSRIENYLGFPSGLRIG